jgi:peroxiredoxin
MMIISKYINLFRQPGEIFFWIASASHSKNKQIEKMKKVIFTLLAALPVLAFAQNDSTFVVKGSIGKFNAPAKAYLAYAAKGKGIRDSAVIVNGNFEFKGAVSAPTQATLFINRKGTGIRPPYDMVNLYLEHGAIAVTGADSAKTAKISGTPTNKDNERYKLAYKPIQEKYKQLSAKRKAATPEQDKSAEFNKELDAFEAAIDNEENALNKKFIQENPKSVVSLNLIRNLSYSADYADLKPLYDALSPEIKNSAAGKSYATILGKLAAVALGKVAPEFAQADTAGKLVSLSSFRGKYLLIDFWASWCGPCRAENPNVVKAYNKYKDKNFTILGVSLDQPDAKAKWLGAIKQDGLTWTQVSDLKYWNNEVSQAYGVQAIPQNFLLDPNGKIVGKNLRGEALEKKLEELLGKADAPKAE